MTNKIEPALTAEEWQTRQVADLITASLNTARTAISVEIGGGRPRVGLIALLNDSLPDSDPRKITRRKLDYLREVARTQTASLARSGEDLVALRLIEFADALESYLPPADD